jgi:GAF domain-containing protein
VNEQPKAGVMAPALAEIQASPAPPPGPAAEAEFYKRLQAVTARIHDTDNLDQLMLDVSEDICQLFNAERLTLYAVSRDQTSIVSKIKTGLTSSQDLRLPISPQSIAGYVALSKQLLNLRNVYDEQALRRIHPDLTFLKAVDKGSGYLTRQLLVAPITDGNALLGVLQIINNRDNQVFGDLEVDGATQLCRTLATAIRQRVERSTLGLRRSATKYDGLVQQGVLTADALEQCWRQSRSEAQPVEQVIMSRHKVLPAQIGRSLSWYFDVAYEPFKASRSRIDQLSSFQGPVPTAFGM